MAPSSLFQTGRHSRERISDFHDRGAAWWGPDPQEGRVHEERRATVERLWYRPARVIGAPRR